MCRLLNPTAHNSFFRRAGFFTALLFLTAATNLSAAGKTSVILTVHDSLTAPNQPAIIEATLIGKSSLTEAGQGGEPIELLIAGNVVATAMTGSDGRAILSYTSKIKGVIPFTVRVGSTSSIAVTEVGANLAVWERRSPMMAVEMTALIEDAVGQGSAVIFPGKDVEGRRPLPDAAADLGKLTQFYYNVLYVLMNDKAVAATTMRALWPGNGSKIRNSRPGTSSCCRPVPKRSGQNWMNGMLQVGRRSK